MIYIYRIYGLLISVPFPIPALSSLPGRQAADAVVDEGPVPHRLERPLAMGANWEAEQDRFLFRGGARSGRFLVDGGNSVVVERNPQANERLLAAHFLTSVLAAVLRHRGFLVLHANAAATSAGAFVVAGASGAGKSTTLAGLMARGCLMLSDDLTAIRVDRTGPPQVLAGVPLLHLNENAAIGLGREFESPSTSARRPMKAAIPAGTCMSPQPAPLTAMYVLNTHDGANLVHRRLSGVERFFALMQCVYGPVLPAEHPELFPSLAGIAAGMPLLSIDRPRNQWTLDLVLDLMLPCPERV